MCRPRGHLKFPRNNIRDAHKPESRQILICIDCREAHAKAEEKLQRALLQSNVWKCTCPGRRERRMHQPSNHACRLYPSQAGQRRWPGGNHNVSESEWKLIEKMRAYIAKQKRH